MRWLTAIPIYNEAKSVRDVIREVRRFSPNILVVDDGSTDDTPNLLDQEAGLFRVTHPNNRGYGAAVQSAFEFAMANGFDVLVTMDCDGQHEPSRIPLMIEAVFDADIVSGSRYLRDFRQNTPVPEERLRINRLLTAEINQRYGLHITDAFCGFKAYRASALEKLRVSECGWGMPLELWVQAARLGMRVREVGVPRLYVDPNRSFGTTLDDPQERLAYYRRVLDAAEIKFPAIPPASTPCREFCS